MDNINEIQKYLNSKIFKIISQSAEELSMQAFVIGGYVRDYYLNRPSSDIDVVVLGSGLEMAQMVQSKLGKRAHAS